MMSGRVIPPQPTQLITLATCTPTPLVTFPPPPQLSANHSASGTLLDGAGAHWANFPLVERALNFVVNFRSLSRKLFMKNGKLLF